MGKLPVVLLSDPSKDILSKQKDSTTRYLGNIRSLQVQALPPNRDIENGKKNVSIQHKTPSNV